MTNETDPDGINGDGQGDGDVKQPLVPFKDGELAVNSGKETPGKPDWSSLRN